MNRENAIRGGLYGLLIGDAVGVPYEFCDPVYLPAREQLEMIPPADFYRSHPSVTAGTWSDNGSQALCLLESLLENQSLDPDDIMQKFADWHMEGYLAINHQTFDCGIQTTDTIRKYVPHHTPVHLTARDDKYSNGNGALMRVLPLALWHQGSDDELIDNAFKQSHITHAHIRSKLCCALYCLWARYVLQGQSIQNGYQNSAEFLYQKYQYDSIEFIELTEHIQPLTSQQFLAVAMWWTVLRLPTSPYKNLPLKIQSKPPFNLAITPIQRLV